MQPDSMKSDSQRTKDKASGGMDSAMGSMQPDSMKSDSQKAGDKGQSMFQQAKDTVSDTFSSDHSKSCSLSCEACEQSADCMSDRQAVNVDVDNKSEHKALIVADSHSGTWE